MFANFISLSNAHSKLCRIETKLKYILAYSDMIIYYDIYLFTISCILYRVILNKICILYAMIDLTQRSRKLK